MERQGGSFVYEIIRSGQPVAAGFDMLSPDENTAPEGITDRLFGRDKQRDAA